MKILHTVEFYPPSVGGMQEVVKQLSERLASLGHEVHVATTKLASRAQKKLNGVNIIEFEIYGNAMRGLRGEIEKYSQLLLNGHYDIITNFAAQQWATDVTLPLLDHIPAKKVFVPTGFSGLHHPAYRSYFEAMKTWLHQYDMNVFLSHDYQDIRFARTCGVEKMILIPNGAAAEEFLFDPDFDIKQRLGIPDSNFFILHVGSHTGAKGHAEAIQIFELANVSHATLLIIGNQVRGGCLNACRMAAAKFNNSPLRSLDHKQLLIHSLDRTHTVAAYKAADLFLFPSHIECSPIVLFECLAAKTPFLTTDVGNASEIIQWSGAAGQLLPTKKNQWGFAMADICHSVPILEAIINNPLQRDSMKQAGFNAWLSQFTWDIIAHNYEHLYRQLLSGQP